MKSITALWKDWEATKGETNSLRLFLDGERLSPNDVSSSLTWQDDKTDM
jgi:hypothetical protein